MVLFTVAFTFPVCTNSFLMSFCPLTGSSSSFRMFAFRIFKESFKDFRRLLLDLDLKDWEGKFSFQASSWKQVSQSFCLYHSALQSRWSQGKHTAPTLLPMLRSKRRAGEHPCGHSGKKKRERMIKGNYGSNGGCQLNRWPTCGSAFDEDRSLFSWTRRPRPLGFPPHWAPAHSHHRHCPHWLGDTSKVRERAAQSCHSPMNKGRSLFWSCWPWQEISDV